MVVVVDDVGWEECGERPWMSLSRMLTRMPMGVSGCMDGTEEKDVLERDEQRALRTSTRV